MANGKIADSKSVLSLNMAMITILIMLLGWIPLSRMIGDEGMGYFSGALEIGIVLLLLFSSQFEKSIAGLMKLRIRRDMYKSAMRIYKNSYKIVVVLVVLSCCCLVLGHKWIASKLLLVPFSWPSIIFVGILVFCVLFYTPAMGFLNGIGANGILMLGQVLQGIFCVAGSLVGAKLGISYGQKIATLLVNDSMIPMYAAAGAMAGVALSQVVVLIYYYVCLMMYMGIFRSNYKVDVSRKGETSSEIIKQIIVNFLPTGIQVCILQIIVLIGQHNYMLGVLKAETPELLKAYSYLGCFYGKYMVAIGIGSIICILPLRFYINAMAKAYQRDDYRAIRDRYEKGLMRCIVTGFALTVITAILGTGFIKALYTGMNTTPVQMIQVGSCVILFYALVYFNLGILDKLEFQREGLFLTVIAFVGFLIINFIIGRRGIDSIQTFVISYFLFFAILAILSTFIVIQKMKVSISYMKCFVFPLLSGAISGLIVMILNKIFLAFMPAIIEIILVGLIGFAINILILILLRVLNESHLQRYLLGSLWIAIGRAVGQL